ncbi:hypothetical protein [Carnobacterium maltaromaticum]
MNKGLKKVNLLVVGKSGVGKFIDTISTQLMTIPSFVEQIMKQGEIVHTGVGKPVTNQISLIEQEDFPVRIYFDLNRYAEVQSAKEKFEMAILAKDASISKVY